MNPAHLSTRALEVALWEDALRALALSIADATFNMDEPEQTQNLEASVMTQKLRLRAEFGVNKAGAGMYYDVFDISAQVTKDGVSGAFKALASDCSLALLALSLLVVRASR